MMKDAGKGVHFAAGSILYVRPGFSNVLMICIFYVLFIFLLVLPI